MGLDLVVDGISWEERRAAADVHVRMSYSGFNALRQALAVRIGIDLGKMRGWGGDREWGDIMDPLVDLLTHSDCDGRLTWQQCERVAPRLRALQSAHGMCGPVAAIMERCARDKRDLIFA